MAAETLAAALSLAGALIGLILALELWYRAIVLWARERAFQIRADLFDAALHKNCFDDEAYRQVRQRINGFLRWAENLTGLRVLALLMGVAALRDKPDTSIPSVDKSPMRGAILQADRRLGQLIRVEIFIATPSGLLLMSGVLVIGQVRRVLRALLAHVVRLGGDDDYARQERDGQWWQSRGGRGDPTPPGILFSG